MAGLAYFSAYNPHKMLKRSAKYMAIILLNGWILSLLVIAWTDKVYLAFFPGARLTALLMVLGLTVVLTVAIGLLMGRISRSKPDWTKAKKLLITLGIVLVSSSYFYLSYLSKVSVAQDDARKALTDLIETDEANSEFFKIGPLTIEQYRILQAMAELRQLPDEAWDIYIDYGSVDLFTIKSLGTRYLVPKTFNMSPPKGDPDRELLFSSTSRNNDSIEVIYRELRD